jgi:hypothetical protein
MVMSRRRRACVLSAATLAAAASPALCLASEEAGRYRFEAFVAGPEDQRLPAELRARVRSAQASDLLATDRAVEIEWVGREGPGLRGYRLTAMIDGGPLSGVAARWTVAPGTGESGLLPGPRLYRLHLPLRVDGRLKVRAALEAVREDGTSVLLAVQDSIPARTAGDGWLAGPAWISLLPSTGGDSALLPPFGAALALSSDTRIPAARSVRSPRDPAAAPSFDGNGPGRPRGPPAVDC